ncbi:MAG: class I SAM-dependent methyltransferase [Pseudobdellovibrio sp.]
METVVHAFNKTHLESWTLNRLLDGFIRWGTLTLVTQSGIRHRFEGKAGPTVEMRLRKPINLLKLIFGPSLFIGEAYMNGEVTFEQGTLRDFIEIVFRNSGPNVSHGWLNVEEAWNFLGKRFQQINSPLKSFKNVEHHYDLSPKFYELFLDKNGQYSCAYFADGVKSLETAQKEKMNHISRKLLLEKDHHVLDIGCGWGGLSCYIARTTGATVTGVTLSKLQLEHARAKAKKEGLDKKVSFELVDYRNVPKKFDRVVSVGMFEHVGVNHYADYFDKIKNLLNPEGVALVHSIGRTGKPSATNPWIRKYIFPGGYIPSLSEVLPHVEKSGLVTTDLEVLRLHYAKTLKQWRSRFAAHKEKVEKKHGEKFYRMWEFYLTISELSFEYLDNMVFHLQMALDPKTVPTTRNYLYSENN